MNMKNLMLLGLAVGGAYMLTRERTVSALPNGTFVPMGQVIDIPYGEDFSIAEPKQTTIQYVSGSTDVLRQVAYMTGAGWKLIKQLPPSNAEFRTTLVFEKV